MMSSWRSAARYAALLSGAEVGEDRPGAAVL